MTVINGAIGKSPAIDKMNQLKKEQMKYAVAEEMERLIYQKTDKKSAQVKRK